MNDFSENNLTFLKASLFLLCSAESTGTLFIMTSNNESAQFVLEHGEVTNFSFEKKYGLEGIRNFKNEVYNKHFFIKDYRFPLTTSSNVDCSDSLLNQLGVNVCLIAKDTKGEKQLDSKYVKHDFFEGLHSSSTPEIVYSPFKKLLEEA